MPNKERILVVDDERIILELTSMILRSRGYEALTAESGQDGLQLVATERPALVLLDYMMPVMDGLTALKQIRQQYPETYVIMFTGKGSEEIAVELMKAGASDYILKPFNNQDLVDRIENVLRLRRIELHNRELVQERERLLREIEVWNQELERRVEEKTLELEKANREILQVEKLASLGHLSAGMAHEIRNPLNSISLFAQILRSNFQEGEEMAGYVDRILKEVDRIDDLLVKLLAASKRPRFELQAVFLPEVIDRVLDGFADQCSSQGVSVDRQFVTSPPSLQADAAEIEQIFTNLFTNALFEMPQGGELDVRLYHDEQAIHIVVSDSGGGIPEENLNKIFDPFFTTKPRGTGFGLSVVLRIIKNYHGRISVDSTPGNGTRFHIQLPIPPIKGDGR
jgi:signal transduction histidine kinase